MSYLEKLRKFEETGLRLWEILCAEEVSLVFGISCATYFDDDRYYLSEEDAETIIGFVYDWVMNTDATPNEVANIIKEALLDNAVDGNTGLSIEDFENDYEKCREYINNCF